MLENKDYCDYDTCVDLKELGCPYLSNDKVYVGKGGLYCKCNPPYDSQKYNEGELLSSFYSLGCYKEVGTTIPAITLYGAQKWLREEKFLLIVVDRLLNGEYVFSVVDILNYSEEKNDTTNSYEEALLKGIKEAVKILKNQ